jgi:hypothetical protein
MAIRIDNQVTNQLGTPAIVANSYANRPSSGYLGRLFVAVDTHQIYRDEITAWNLIADAGSGSGNLASVCANGNSTSTGINLLSSNLFISGSGTITAQALSDGGILFPITGTFSQDNTNFVWDNTNKRLGIGNSAPGAKLDVHGTGTIMQMNGTGTSNSYLQFQNAGTNKWYIGNSYNATNNDFIIYDNTSTAIRAYFLNTGYAILPNSVIIGSSTRTSSYGLDVYNSANFRSAISGLTATFSSFINAGVVTGDSGATGTPSIVAKVGGGGNNGTFGFGNDTNYLIKGGSDFGNMQFVTGGSANTRMTITGGGGIIMGTAAPTSPLVNQLWIGAQNTGGIFVGTAASGSTGQGGYSIGYDSADIGHANGTASGTTYNRFLYNGSVIGSITQNGTTGVLYNITSDYRLKEDFKEVKGLDKISLIKVYDYQWIGTNERMDGVLAHELQEVISYAVSGKKDELYEDGTMKAQGVDYSKLVPILVKAIQELNDKLVRNNIN